MNPVRKTVNYLQEVRLEVSKVSWPSRAQTIRLTLIVLAASVFIGLLVTGLDSFFTTLLDLTLKAKQ